MQRTLILFILLWQGCQSTPERDPCGDFPCSDHGDCVVLNSTPTCVCDPGYLPSASGWLCLAAADTSLCAGVDCSGHGTCISSKGQAQCLCKDGYHAGVAGLSCIEPCAEQTCGGHGQCTIEDGQARCLCQPGFLLAEDGLTCLPLNTSGKTVLNYSLIYDSYPEYSIGKAFLNLGETTSDKLMETVYFNMWLDRGGRGLARKTRQVIVTDSSGKQIEQLWIDDEYTQGNVKRRRRGEYTFASGAGTALVDRAGRSISVPLTYKGSMTPISMPGGYEYPGWTLGCFSPMFYIQAFSRYDQSLMGVQELEVLWPTSGLIGTINVEADESWTTASPVLSFPDFQIKATYHEGTPVRISVEDQGMSWVNSDVFPVDLNLMDLEATTPLVPTPLPQDIVESTLSITSADGTVLAGTLTGPQISNPAAPAILLVSDTHAQDRDTPISRLPATPLYAHLAAHLAHAGFTTLRYDPRGRGDSQGEMSSATLTTLRQDAEAALAALNAAPGVPDVNVFVLSHGGSSTLALPILGGSTPVRGYIGLAPLLNQPAQVYMYGREAVARAAGFSEKFIERNYQSDVTALDQLSTGTFEGESYRGLSKTLWEELLAFDGSTYLSAFSGPLLIVYGDQDLEIPPEQIQAFEELAAQTGKDNLTLHTLEGITHSLTEGSKADLWEAAPLPLDLPVKFLAPLLDWINLNRADER